MKEIDDVINQTILWVLVPISTVALILFALEVLA